VVGRSFVHSTYTQVGAAVGTAVVGATYEVDRATLSACVDVAVSVPTEDDDATTADGRLCLGTFPCSVVARPGTESLARRVGAPRLAPVFDERLARAACCLVRARRAAPRQEVLHNGTTPSGARAPSIVGPVRVLAAAARGVDALGRFVARGVSSEGDDDALFHNSSDSPNDDGGDDVEVVQRRQSRRRSPHDDVAADDPAARGEASHHPEAAPQDAGPAPDPSKPVAPWVQRLVA